MQGYDHLMLATARHHGSDCRRRLKLCRSQKETTQAKTTPKLDPSTQPIQ